MSLSISTWRVPMGPTNWGRSDEPPAAWATLIESLWTSKPTKSVVLLLMADLRGLVLARADQQCGSDPPWANPRYSRGSAVRATGSHTVWADTKRMGAVMRIRWKAAALLAVLTTAS